MPKEYFDFRLSTPEPGHSTAYDYHQFIFETMESKWVMVWLANIGCHRGCGEDAQCKAQCTESINENWAYDDLVKEFLQSDTT